MTIRQNIVLGILILIVIRGVSLSSLPFLDTTEARYAEISRIMVETQNWTTPQFDYNVPFWGKPPLYTWASAAFVKLFGNSELALRLPHFLVSILSIFLVAFFAKKVRINPITTAFILMSSLGFFMASGMVMTEALLTFSMIASMVGFYLGWFAQRSWAYLGFVGLGLGLLAKGPIILVLVGLAIFIWLVANYGLIQGFRELFRRLPFISGMGVTLLVALPWYLAAELATPGFIDYFIIGEHWSRFTTSGWEGDLYGTAHDEPRGMIWVYWIAVAFPWSFIFFYHLFKRQKSTWFAFKAFNKEKPLTSFLLIWACVPMILFTFAGNILPIYVMPGIPAFALLFAKCVEFTSKRLIAIGLVVPIALFCVLVTAPNLIEHRTDKWLLENTETSTPIYYFSGISFSGRYYSNGTAKVYEPNNHPDAFYLVIEKHFVKELLNDNAGCIEKARNKRKLLFKCNVS